MIYCIGDSFTAGDELKTYVSVNYPCPDAWPAVLGTKLGEEVVNLGRGGVGNTRIVKRAIDVTLEHQPKLIIVAWTNPKRLELADDYGIFDVWPEKNTERMAHRNERSIPLKWLATSQNDPLIDAWYYGQWLRDIILLQSFFKAQDQRYLMVQTHQTEHWNCSIRHYHQRLFREINSKYFIGWYDEAMVTWTKDLPQGEGGHFLEEGHRIVAEKIYEYIRRFEWFS